MSDRYFFSEVIFIMRPQREPTISILFDHFFLLEETDTQIITYILLSIINISVSYDYTF